MAARPGLPLWSAPGLLLTPHVAGVSTQTIPRARAIVWDQLARYAAGQPPRNVVGERGY
jgi:phosphoglycerate dehydrogenase-like enzyme